MDKREIVEGIMLEIRRGTIVLCVLSQLKQASYGYDLIDRLAKLGMSVEANTLYPLLRRLEGQGLLSSEWNTESTKPRKYYKTTSLCDEVLSEIKTRWKATADIMKNILDY